MVTINIETETGKKIHIEGATSLQVDYVLSQAFNSGEVIKPILPITGQQVTLPAPEIRKEDLAFREDVARDNEGRKVSTFNPNSDNDKTGPLPKGIFLEPKTNNLLMKAKYTCPSCNEEGGRYLKPDVVYMKCHKCKTKINCEPINERAKDGTYTSDSEGCFFKGSEKYTQQGPKPKTPDVPWSHFRG